jgi:hypothetical protein
MQEISLDPRITYAKPDWSAIAEKGLLCADMHYHTSYSDSYTDVRKAVDLARSRQVGVAITDHNLVGGAKKAQEMGTDLFLVPGIEISTSDGPHVLVYFYDMNDLVSFWKAEIKPKLQVNPWLALRAGGETEWLLDRLESENCVVSAAHPMGYLGSNKGMQVCVDKGYLSEDTALRFDAYEVLCSGMTHIGNVNSLQNAMRMDLGYTGGTDGHLMNELGNVLTVSDACDLDGFLDSIKKHTNTVIGREKSPQTKLLMGSATLSRFMTHAPSSVYVQGLQTVRRVQRYTVKTKDKRKRVTVGR